MKHDARKICGCSAGRQRRRRRGLVLIGITLFALQAAVALRSVAGDEPNKPGEPAAAATAAKTPSDESLKVDPAAAGILRAAGDYLKEAKSFTFKADVWEDLILPTGQKVQSQRSVEVGVRRPDRLYAYTRSTPRNRASFYDGKTLTIYNKEENFYGAIDAPDNIDKTVDFVEDKFGIVMPLADLIVSDMYGEVTKGVRGGHYLGRQNVGGVRCHHLAFSQETIDWEAWIEDGPRPAIRRFLITYKAEEHSPQFTATLSDWNFAAALPDYAFIFQPPIGASKIDVMEKKSESEVDEGEARVAKESQGPAKGEGAPKPKDEK
jgi:hypothetical protein